MTKTETRDHQPLNLGRIDITSDHVSFRELEEALENSTESKNIIENDTTIKNAGKEPRDYIHQYEAKLHAAEIEAIQNYTDEAHDLTSLKKEIQECDEVMKDIEDTLNKYKSDLATVSTEIRSLQEQSQSMKTRLINRQALQTGLSSFIERIAIMPSLIQAIMQTPSDSEEFSSALKQLHAKLVFVNSDHDIKRSAAFRDIAPEIERLRIASIARCRELLLDKIYDLRRPKSNIHAKQRSLLQHKAAVAFLRVHSNELYQEARAAYAEKVSGKLLDVFKNYWAAMERAEETRVTPNDLLGAPESNTSTAAGMTTMLTGVLSLAGGGGGSSGGGGAASLLNAVGVSHAFSSTPPSLQPSSLSRSEVFQLNSRTAVLAHINAPPLIFASPSQQQQHPNHAAPGPIQSGTTSINHLDAASATYPFESLFRSISKLLMDTSSHEYLFCLEFWGQDGRAMYKESFGSITSFVQTSFAADLQDVYDPIAVLLCIRINREHSLIMARKAIPSLDEHFDAINLVLWPRLKSLLDLQLTSINTMASSLHDSGSISGGELQATRVHPLAERYAALTGSVLALHADIVDGPLETNIERMRYAVMNLLLTMSRGFHQRGKGTVFLIHNFSHVVRALKEAGERPLPASASATGMGGGPGMGSSHSSSSSIAATAMMMKTSSSGSIIDASRMPGTTNSSGAVVMTAPGLGAIGTAVLESFEESLQRATSLYIDSRLTAGAPQLIAFVKRGETAMANAMRQLQQSVAGGGNGSGVKVEGYGPKEAMPVAKDFTARWERIVDVLNREIAQDFGATETGLTVQQAAFTQLVLYWSRFIELLKHQGTEGADITQHALQISTILYALKQYRLDL